MTDDERAIACFLPNVIELKNAYYQLFQTMIDALSNNLSANYKKLYFKTNSGSLAIGIIISVNCHIKKSSNAKFEDFFKFDYR